MWHRGSPRDVLLQALALCLFLCGGAAWVPGPEALAATAGRELRVLHRHAKSNAFFYFRDEADEAFAYAAQTPSEADAVEVTGQVTGYNVELLEALARKADWSVRYFVMCEETYACAANQTTGLLPADTGELFRYFQTNMTTFDAIVSPFSLTHETLPYLRWLEPPSLRSGFSAFARAPERERAESLADRLENWTRPFSADVWLTLLVVMLAAGAVYALVVRDEAGGNRADDALHGVFQAGATFTGAGGFEPTSLTGKAFVLVFSFFTLLVVAAYTANLTTFLTITAFTDQPITRIRSFEELGLKPCVQTRSTQAFLDANYPNVDYVPISELEGFRRDVDHNSQLFHFFLDGACDGVVTHSHYGRNTFVHDALNGGGPLGCAAEPVGPVEGEFIYSVPFRDDAEDPLLAAASYAHALLIDSYEKIPIEEKFFPSNPRVAAGCGSGPTDDDQDLVFHFRDMVGYFFVAVVGLAVAIVGVAAGKAARLRAAHSEPEDAADAADAARAPLDAIRQELRGLRDELRLGGRERDRRRKRARERKTRAPPEEDLGEIETAALAPDEPPESQWSTC